MTAQYSMQFGNVAVVVEDLRKATADIKNQLDLLDQKVTRLKSHWTGDAVEAYGIAQRHWNEECARMSSSLNSSGTTLESIAHNTKRTDQQNAGLFGR